MSSLGFTEKRVWIEEKNQYTFNVESGSTRTEIKYCVERLFGVNGIAMNSHRLPESVEEWDLVWDIECITDD